MSTILISLLILLIGGIISLIAGKSKIGTGIGAGSAMIAGVLSLSPVITVLVTGNTKVFTHPWSIPGGNFSLNLDPLSAFFLIPLLIITICAALFGTSYLTKDKKRNGFTWFTYNLLVASMILIVLANNGILFIMAWELMSLSSLLLVLYEHEDAKSLKAGWVYFTASHAGAAFLFPLFFILAKFGHGFDFTGITLHSINGSVATVLFVFAIIGFGCKAGFMPLHVWLPEAHPAAPSHVSALMSAVMIKMGIYGILRTLSFLGTPPLSWGVLLLIIGIISGVIGILLALCQNDIKRLLAYSSVENIGIITAGLGIGLLGITYNNHFVAVAGFAGAFLHIVNHAFFKGLLFLCAGAVVHATGTRDMEKMGGILKKMKFTGAAFLIGAFAISGLPPLNGFLSEFLIYLAGYTTLTGQMIIPAIGGLAIIMALGIIGGFAITAFTKSFGTIFLGEPRTVLSHAHYKLPLPMKISIFTLAIGCIVIAIGFTFSFMYLVQPLSTVMHYDFGVIQSEIYFANKSILNILIVSGAITVVMILGIITRSIMLKKRPVTQSVTWDCGYAKPTARIQYTGSSFVEPVVSFFSSVLKPHKKILGPDGYLPSRGAFHSEVEDMFMKYLFIPLFSWITKIFSLLKWLQGGKVHAYVMYIALAALTALIVTFSL